MKTSVYLDQHQKDQLNQAAALTGRSQAELIRDGIDQVIQEHLSARPAMRASFRDESMVGRTEVLLESLGS